MQYWNRSSPSGFLTCATLVAIVCFSGCDSAPPPTNAAAPAAPLVPPPPPGVASSTGSGGLTAQVGPIAGKLKRTISEAGSVVYTPNGEFGGDEVLEPWFLGMTKKRNPELDPEIIARNAAQSQAGSLAPRILSSQPVTINGMEGYEFLTEATPQAPNNVPLSIYVCVLFPPDDRFFLLRGSAMKSVEGEWLPEFRAIAHSWKATE